MIAIRLVSVFGLLLVASTAAQAGSPATAAPAGSAPTGLESTLPNLELGLSEVDYALADGRVETAPRDVHDDARDGARSPSLAQFLKAPAPYRKLLPQAIDDRGAGYRVWF
jgi:hypothetical protein